MAGTREGGKLSAEKIKKKYGYGFYAKIGSLGGKNGHIGGFNNKEVARRAGAIGGAISRRRKT